MNERRNIHPRYPIGQPVTLLLGDDGDHVSCDLEDMSLEGARLTSVPLQYLPPRFSIFIHAEGVSVPCKLRWINGLEAGVFFTGDPQPLPFFGD